MSAVLDGYDGETLHDGNLAANVLGEIGVEAVAAFGHADGNGEFNQGRGRDRPPGTDAIRARRPVAWTVALEVHKLVVGDQPAPVWVTVVNVLRKFVQDVFQLGPFWC